MTFKDQIAMPDSMASPAGYEVDISAGPAGTWPVTVTLNNADPYWLSPAPVQKTFIVQFVAGTFGTLYYPSPFEIYDNSDFPLTVSPGTTSAAIPKTPYGDGERLVLLALRGDHVPMNLDLRYLTTDPSAHAYLDTATRESFRLSLIDAYGRLVPEGEFLVHSCPRLAFPPGAPSTCSDRLTPSSGGIATFTLNDGVDNRGYMGIELTKAPTDPRTYFVKVESLGQQFRIKQMAYLKTADGPAGEYQGAFALCTVQGAEILDANFQRIDPLTVDQVTSAYVRMSDAGQTTNSFTVDFITEDEDGTYLDQASDVSLTRLGNSSTFLSEPITLYPEWEAGGGGANLRALTGPSKKVVVKKQKGKAKAKKKSTSAVVASRVTKSGADYIFPAGTRTPVSVGISRSFFDNAQHLFICSPAAGDCGSAQMLPPTQVTWTLGPLGIDQEGDNQIARMENEPGETPPQAYVRGIRISTARTTDGYITLSASSGVQPVKAVKLQVRRPVHLGSRTDGYPVTYPYPGGETLLEPIVLDMADKYGIPPQFLMSQVTKEAVLSEPSPPRYNPYSYAYEVYGFDFEYLTGDEQECCSGSNHKLMLLSGFPFAASGITSSGQVEFLPRPTLDILPEPVLDVAPQPTQPEPCTLFQIPNLNGHPIYWSITVVDVTTGGGQTFVQARPGTPTPGTNEFVVDARMGTITFGSPPQHPGNLRVSYTPLEKITRTPPSGFGSALVSAPSVTEIRAACQTCPLRPPNDPAQTLSGWARSHSPASSALTRPIRQRYGLVLTLEESWNLLKEDPSFEVQAQFYGGASFGLLQVWPANADTTINRAPTSLQGPLRGLFNPLTEPGTKLFNPPTGVEFGAAADVYGVVRAEGSSDLYPYEGTCTAEATSPPFNDCTWNRYWARRFTAFNTGNDNDTGTQANKFNIYGWPIVAGSGAFTPILQP